MTPAELIAWAIVAMLFVGIAATVTVSRFARRRRPRMACNGWGPWTHTTAPATRAQLIASEMRACLERDRAESELRIRSAEMRATFDRLERERDAALAERDEWYRKACAELKRRPAGEEMSRHAQPFRGD